MAEHIFDRYTDDQLVAGVSNALAESNLEAVEAIMLVLAGQNPKRAQEVYDTMLVGVLIASDRDGV
jgi:hypothetical protein